MYIIYTSPMDPMGLCRWLSIISGYRNHRSDIWRPTAGNEKVASHSLQSSYLGLQRACFPGLVPPFYGRWVRQQVSIVISFGEGLKLKTSLCSEGFLPIFGHYLKPFWKQLVWNFHRILNTLRVRPLSCVYIPAFHPCLIAETTCPFGFHGRRVRHEIIESACEYSESV